jgi:branched-chain amino acid transport system ATP-binding protein
MFDYFPRLKERRNTKRRQHVGRRAADADDVPLAAGQPAVMLIDEPTEGLAPKIVAQVASASATCTARASRCCWWSRSWPLR